jgi:hypothetical protein
MASKRSGHTATKLADGRVLLVGGVTGGFTIVLSTSVAPTFTGTCEIFDPATDTLTATAALPGSTAGARAFHGASLLGTGDVLVTGGNYSGGSNGEAVSTNSCVRWDGSTWHVAPPLPTTVAWHNQVPLDDGRAFVCGGLSVSEFALTPKAFGAALDGFTYESLGPVGLNEGIPASTALSQGAMEAVRMHDGAYLFTGGVVAAGVLATSLVYTPNP